MEVSGQLAPQNQFGRRGEEKNLLPLPEIEPQFLGPSPH
jgi:hypothetical protein